MCKLFVCVLASGAKETERDAVELDTLAGSSDGLPDHIYVGHPVVVRGTRGVASLFVSTALPPWYTQGI